MDRPSQLKYVNVRAFVAVFGPGPQPGKVIREVCGVTTGRFRLGSAQVTFVGRGDEPEAIDGSVTSLVLCTGRPFFEDRLFEGGVVPRADELDGKFARLVLDARRLELSTDCIGAGGAFYAQQGGRLYVGSHLGLLLEALPHVPSMNDLGIAAHLLVRAQIFDQTHFDGVYRLPAGGVLSAETGLDDNVDLRVTPGRGIKALLDIDTPSLAPESFRELLDSSVERERYDRDSVLMLSGGYDSYSIALARAHVPTRAATYGERYSIDFVRGRRRARRLGMEFLPVPYEDWNLETYRDLIVGLNAGSSGLQTAHNVIAFDWLSDKANLASIGFIGDVYRGKILDKLDKGPHETTAPPILMRKSEDPILSEVFADEKKLVGEFAMDRFSDWSRDVGPHRSLSMMKLEWQQGREFSMLFDLCDWFVPSSYPLMHRQLLASWLQADLADVRCRQVFKLALGQSLAERGFNTDYRDGFGGRLWVRSLAATAALVRGKRTALRCDWQAVIKRSKTPFTQVTCRHRRLSDLTNRAWQRYLAGEDRSPIAIAYRSGAMVAAHERFLTQDSGPSASVDPVTELPRYAASRATV